ncbi:hypothetical protein F4775DRAFT_343553 [Biscogniauxia sp. FL1348]|nr:hypothetical protein F4775DRAFT_343553 [Biscogniauxia sp. FL1348]
MAQTTGVFSLKDILISSESSSATTPSSTTASDEQREPVQYNDESSAEDTDSGPNTHPCPRHSRPLHEPSHSPESEDMQKEDQSASGVEDVQSIIVTKVINLLSLWSKLHMGTATGISTETKEALLHHLNTQVPQSPRSSLLQRLGEDAGRQYLPDSSETTSNCVISHGNFKTLLGMIHEAGKYRAFDPSKLEAMGQAIQAQTVMAQDEKSRADRLETRLQDMQRRYDVIQEEKQRFQCEAQAANRRLDELIKSRQGEPEVHTRPANEQLNVNFGLRMLRIAESHLKQSLLERSRLKGAMDQAKEETILLQTKLAESERQNQKVKHGIAKAKRRVDKLERRLERERSKYEKRKATARTSHTSC